MRWTDYKSMEMKNMKTIMQRDAMLHRITLRLSVISSS